MVGDTIASKKARVAAILWESGLATESGCPVWRMEKRGEAGLSEEKYNKLVKLKSLGLWTLCNGPEKPTE